MNYIGWRCRMLAHSLTPFPDKSQRQFARSAVSKKKKIKHKYTAVIAADHIIDRSVRKKKDCALLSVIAVLEIEVMSSLNGNVGHTRRK